MYSLMYLGTLVQPDTAWSEVFRLFSFFIALVVLSRFDVSVSL